jgi:hypothetical protein
MGLRMVSPTKRDGSANYVFRKRVPADVLAKLRDKLIVIEFPAMGTAKERLAHCHVGSEIKFSVGTHDPDIATARIGFATSHVQGIFEAARSGESALSQKQIVALAGEIYRLYIYIDRFTDNPGSPNIQADLARLPIAMTYGSTAGDVSLAVTNHVQGTSLPAVKALGADSIVVRQQHEHGGRGAFRVGRRDLAVHRVQPGRSGHAGRRSSGTLP